MKNAEPVNIDKSTWGPGPWQAEPDRVEWKDPDTGMPCMAIRNHSMGFWCGYAAVIPGHPAYGKGYDDIEAEVHGGLTYANKCHGHICHVPAEGETDEVWWFGFDCGHCMDKSPGLEATLREIDALGAHHDDDIYRDLNYVVEEVKSLAAQLHAQK